MNTPAETVKAIAKEHGAETGWNAGVEMIRDQLKRDAAEIKRLRKALEPFSDLAKCWCCDDRLGCEVVTGAVVHAGDLQQARLALEGK